MFFKLITYIKKLEDKKFNEMYVLTL